MSLPLDQPNREDRKTMSNPDAPDPQQEKKKEDDFFLQAPSVTLPKGGGAIKGIDEKFSVNAVNGTGALSIPLPSAPARKEKVPSLQLSYNSGSGNSEFGLGWSISIPAISRKTDKGLPQYNDGMDSDTYLFAGAEDLVPLLQKDDDAWVAPPPGHQTVDGVAYTLFGYRPRIEGGFARIERWVNTATGETHWRTISQDNKLCVYGLDPASRIADPLDALKVFKWLLSYTCDDKGNLVMYRYKVEDFAGIGKALFEKNKLHRCTNSYLQQVWYGNKTPYYRGNALPDATDFMFRLVLDYGEYDPAGMGFHTNINHDIPADLHLPKTPWTDREDAFSNNRAGFEVRTYRRCRRFLLFHCFDELRPTATPCLVQSMELVYNTQLVLENTTDTIPGFSYLVRIIRKGHQLNGAGTSYDTQCMPAVDLTYRSLSWDTSLREIKDATVHQTPSPGGAGDTQWIDLYNEGIQGLLMESAGGAGWYYQSNLGNGQFSDPQPITPKPSFSGLSTGTLTIRELAGDGKKYAVGYSGAQQGFFGLSEDNAWQSFQPFIQLPNLDHRNTNLKWIDLDGDGLPDLLLSEEEAFLWYPAKGEKGFDPPSYALRAKDEERGPAIVFADDVQSIYLADMTGDGLTDIVRIRNGEVCYWANKGYGRFSARVAMENAPFFDHPDNFNPAYLRLADLDGSGTTDIVYLGRKDFRVWSNLNGNAWRARPIIINPFPDIHLIADISVFDLLGTGTSCIVWSSSLPGDRSRPVRYIDITNGKKPHLLIGYDNNLGKQVSVEYQSSTQFYLEDKKKGTPWITRLPFPVQVVSRTTIADTISKAHFTTSYSYHHGYYDQREREFRGFGRVDQTDTEDYTKFVRADNGAITDATLHQPPIMTRTWFHTGAYLRKDIILQQFKKEYFQNPDFTEIHLPDAYIQLPTGMTGDDLSAGEYIEAFRACKGRMLRKEVYALDGTSQEPFPYTVTEENGYIRLLQPRGKNKYAVYLPATSESFTYNYERVPADPRIKHDCNLEIDEYNNVVRSLSVVYPRQTPEPGLPAAVTAAQALMHRVLTDNQFTNDISTATDHRLRAKAGTRTWELTGPKPAAVYYTAAELKQQADAAIAIAFTDTPDITKTQKRLLTNERSLYLADDAVTPLPFQQQASKGIQYESYRLAFTAQLLTNIYAGKADPALLALGQYRSGASLLPLFPPTDPADDWWMPSGRQGYPANPDIHFFLPDRFLNPYGKIYQAAMDTKYHLYVPVIQDPIGNQSSVPAYDLRTIQPLAIKDPNDNISEVRFNILGMIVGTSEKGKGTEADDFDGFQTDLDTAAIDSFFNDPTGQGAGLLQHATNRIVYDLHHLPICAATIQRERHYRDVQQNGGPDKLQYSLEYSGGLGQVLLKKIHATPGVARFIDDAGQLQSTDTTPNPRWLGNGRIVLNNKGKPVKQYQPYFSTNHRYEDDSRLVEVGPTNILFYDPADRVIRKELPNETYERLTFTGWKRASFDFNDTVLDSQWYNKRFHRLIDAALIADGKDPALEQEAAVKAAKHDSTPFVTHLDALTGHICKIQHNKDAAAADVFSETTFQLDVKGNIISVTNALGVTVMRYKYDMTNRMVAQTAAESGEKSTFPDVLNNVLRQWDSRNQTFLLTYDDLLRPLTTKVTGGDGPIPLDHIVGQTLYGEGQPDDKLHNLRMQAYKVYDQAGITTRTGFDLNGNPLTLKRQFCAAYDRIINWAAVVPLEADIFDSSMTYDALKRVIAVTAPHIAGQPASAYFPAYNDSGLLGSMQVSIRGGATTPYITQINYNEKGLRTDIQYGNNTKTFYTYDKDTFRLLHLRTTRQPVPGGFANGLFRDGTVLQDLSHTYDPMGNITSIKDDALVGLVYDGQQVDPLYKYEYDALYQVINATGRKQAGQTDIQHTRPDLNYRNQPFINSNSIDPNDIAAFRSYQEIYSYDKAGNMLQQQHIAKNSSWTRDFSYTNGNNQLTHTSLGAFSFDYSYDPHGNLKAMEHLASMVWNPGDALLQLDLGGGGKAWYNYDPEGKRARKVVVRNDGSIKARYYIGSLEIYKEISSAGQVTLQRETLQLMDDKQRVAMADTGTTGGVASPTLVRYQYANHLSSSALELDDTARLISFEEYFPFGTSSFSTTDGAREIPAKRYRYTGKERDEESGLSYHGARYYAPWLCRWTAADKLNKKETGNRYIYVRNNPVIYADDNGAFEEPVHGATTYHLALAAGFTEDEAGEIALATAGMDHDPATAPGLNEQTKEYHFPSFEKALKGVEDEIGKKDLDLTAFGKKLHSLEDVGFVDAPGPHRRGGREPSLAASLRGSGIALAAFGGALIGGGISALKDNEALGITLIVIGAIAAAVGIAAIIVSLLDVAQGIGHPMYVTERGNLSDGLRHTADEAYQDPCQNRDELLKIYDELKKAAQKKHPGVKANDERAKEIIGVPGKEGGIVNADTEEKIQAFLDMPGKDSNNNDTISYAGQVRANCANKLYAIVNWSEEEIDITVENSEVKYKSKVKPEACTK